MSHAMPITRENTPVVHARTVPLDIAVALGIILLFAAGVHVFRYQHAMGESDLYRVLVGILDGAETGRGLAGDLHYDNDFGFGYLAAIYAFADPAVLHDPDRVMKLMNTIGFWSILPSLVCFWFAVRLVHGPLTAMVALVVFAFSPMMLELATSGHPSMPMFGFLSAAAICMFWPATGWRAMLLGLLASVFLLGGLVTRGEIFLAFPWLVLSRIAVGSWRAFMLSGLLRSLPALAAMVVFYGLQQITVHTAMGGTIGHYFFEFYTWATVIPGFVYMAVGCGLATVVAGGLAVLWVGWHDLSRPFSGIAAFLGPVALVLVPLAFFVPNPMPTRHFMLTLAGFGILIGMAAARLPKRGHGTVFAAMIALVAVNQALAEAVRPALLRQNEAHSPYIPVATDYRTATHANIGWAWQRHAALGERRQQSQAFADTLINSCDAHTILLSDEGELFFSRLYAGGASLHATHYRAGRLVGLKGTRNGKTFLVLSKMNAWPDDAVVTILADRSFDTYKLAADPYSMSTYDKTPIPAERAAHFNCASPASQSPSDASRP